MPIVLNGRSRGFTLVEMSIVLVIIGLIIGGILKGQEIISSARQKAVINEVNAVRSAANTYFDRYRALPGDDPAGANNVDGDVKNGDGNGIVGTAQSGAQLGSTAENTGENYEFFNALVAANLVNGAQVTSSGQTTGKAFGTSALPTAPLTGSGLTLVYGTQNGNTDAAATRTTHWLRVHKTVTAPAAAMSPRTLLNIDNQIDDGLPDTGGVRSGTDDTSSCNSTGTSGAYLAQDNLGCIPLFDITQ